MFDQKWAKVLGLALSLPTTIIAMAWGSMKLVQEGIISRPLGLILFLAVVSNSIILMVIYAYKNKNKS